MYNSSGILLLQVCELVALWVLLSLFHMQAQTNDQYLEKGHGTSLAKRPLKVTGYREVIAVLNKLF